MSMQHALTRAVERRADRRHYPYIITESGYNQILAVAGQTHKEFVATRVCVGVRPGCSPIRRFLDDTVASDVNGVLDRDRCPKRCCDGRVAKPPYLTIWAGVNGG